MSEDAAALAGIRANAELVIEQFGTASGMERFGFDAPSVQWLDGFIERQRVRDDVGPEFVGKMVSVLGSYLGECIIRNYGGHWSQADDGWRISFDARNAAYPFAKVEKQFTNGAEDSIYSFFTAIPLVFSLRPSVSPSGQVPQRTKGVGWFARLRMWFCREPDR